MSRNIRSAKSAGTRFERSIADYLKAVLDDDRIDRRAKTGSKDRGDIAGVRFRGERVVLELKDYGGKLQLPEWCRQGEIEAGNDDAPFWAVIAKRRGTTDPAEQWVAMPVRMYAAMLAGHPNLLKEVED